MGDSGRSPRGSPAAPASVSPHGRQEQPWLGDAKSEPGGCREGSGGGTPTALSIPAGAGSRVGDPGPGLGRGVEGKNRRGGWTASRLRLGSGPYTFKSLLTLAH